MALSVCLFVRQSCIFLVPRSLSGTKYTFLYSVPKTFKNWSGSNLDNSGLPGSFSNADQCHECQSIMIKKMG